MLLIRTSLLSCYLPGNVVARLIDGTEVKDWFTCGGNNGTVGTPEKRSTIFKKFLTNSVDKE